MVSDDLVFSPELESSIFVEGSVRCRDGIRIDVEKELRILSGEGADAVVQTVRYRYHVSHEGLGNLFRYDSPHSGHREFHHCHRYDVFGDKTSTVNELRSEEDIPTLGEVIVEAVGWFDAHRDRILN